MLEMKRRQIHQAPAPVQAQAEMDAQAGMVLLKELELKEEISNRSKFRCLCLPQCLPRWMSQALRINPRDLLPQMMCHLQSGCAYVSTVRVKVVAYLELQRPHPVLDSFLLASQVYVTFTAMCL